MEGFCVVVVVVYFLFGWVRLNESDLVILETLREMFAANSSWNSRTALARIFVCVGLLFVVRENELALLARSGYPLSRIEEDQRYIYI